MPLDLANPDRTIHAGVILTKGITEMIDVAPFELFAWLTKDGTKMLGFPEPMVKDSLDIELHWVTEDGGEAPLKSGAYIRPTDSFQSCPNLDIVLMGAHDHRYQTTEGEKAFVRKSYNDCAAFLTICGGIWPMLEAGLLEGKTATAPRMVLGNVKKNFPQVNWVDKRWARDGKVWSSSTLLNGTDLLRAFGEEVWGGKSGMIEAMLDAGHWPKRDVDFKDFSGKQYDVENFE